MNGRCNRISLDTGALLSDLTSTAEEALRLEGERLVSIMAQEVHLTTHGGAPGKPDWRAEIAKNLGHVSTVVTSHSITMDFGYSPSDHADLVRAMLVAYGSGDKADGGGIPIHAGPPGREVWDGDLAGKHPSNAKSTYALPDGFNQSGNHFIGNAIRRAQTGFGGMIEARFAQLPDHVYWEKVKVSPP